MGMSKLRTKMMSLTNIENQDGVTLEIGWEFK
ncbi:uncharacterized protein G2W53_030761 [Senna tora]|uniref:Uncharacterized protein n=1 Tax=Senna tora TaxID=362788 RepID=A0A834T7M8_9FABA|nr:uncharacterized protein G2W53_030761 [Senna tora]